VAPVGEQELNSGLSVTWSGTSNLLVVGGLLPAYPLAAESGASGSGDSTPGFRGEFRRIEKLPHSGAVGTVGPRCTQRAVYPLRTAGQASSGTLFQVGQVRQVGQQLADLAET
jgi:hypothetical protein